MVTKGSRNFLFFLIALPLFSTAILEKNFFFAASLSKNYFLLKDIETISFYFKVEDVLKLEEEEVKK